MAPRKYAAMTSSVPGTRRARTFRREAGDLAYCTSRRFIRTNASAARSTAAIVM